MRKVLLAIIAAVATCGAVPAAASAVLTDQWYTFAYNGVGSGLTNGSSATLGVNPDSLAAPDPDWQFTLLTAGSITFVDGFLSGDQFNITDNGSAIGATSAVPSGNSCGNDITACLGNAAMSRGTFALAAGAHSINGTVLANAVGFSGGAGFFRINSSVPEPSTWVMMLLGLGATGVSLRRKRRPALA